ncbi:MLO-like protein 15 [Platanthera guangdongensis]|uniref:MLO-like protein 15 n=1 Tax=Platanthera guangdongensis TaxID=2320717 RepID=A0ABR2MV99_9ASPA
MGGGEAVEDVTLASTPTWIVAVVCTIIIFISLLFERFLHRLGKLFVRKNQKPLFEALQKMKGELMVMGFISLLLVVSQGAIQRICIPASYNRHLRPCKGKDLAVGGVVGGDAAGWHEYFWLSFVPLILILTIGTKLEHIIMEMVNEVAEKHSTIEGELVIRPSDQYFWFHRPRILLFCIHLILFIVSFQFAYFFCILIAYGYHSCIMDKTEYVMPRLIISFGVRIFASYSILPLYAIVTQMGSTFKPVIFNEHIKEGLIHWASEARKRANRSKSSRTASTQKAEEFQIQSDSAQNDSLMEEGGAEIVEERGPDSS